MSALWRCWRKPNRQVNWINWMNLSGTGARLRNTAQGFLRHGASCESLGLDVRGHIYNLAVALSMQGNHEEAKAIADEIHARFPDYFFGQVIAVRKTIQAGDLETAKTILDKLMKKQELHVTEFGALCGCRSTL